MLCEYKFQIEYNTILFQILNYPYQAGEKSSDNTQQVQR